MKIPYKTDICESLGWAHRRLIRYAFIDLKSKPRLLQPSKAPAAHIRFKAAKSRGTHGGSPHHASLSAGFQWSALGQLATARRSSSAGCPPSDPREATHFWWGCMGFPATKHSSELPAAIPAQLTGYAPGTKCPTKPLAGSVPVSVFLAYIGTHTGQFLVF